MIDAFRELNSAENHALQEKIEELERDKQNKEATIQELMETNMRLNATLQNQTEHCCKCPDKNCPTGWVKVNNSCIWVSSYGENYRNYRNNTDATLDCKRRTPGGRLFEPKNQDMNRQVRDLVTVLDLTYRDKNIWIGINDEIQEGRFVYDSSEEQISYSNWHDGQPDGGNCVAYDWREEHRFFWWDTECSRDYRYICEKLL